MILPGTEKNWPSEVTTNSKPALVVSVDGSPSLFLPTGEHRVGERFEWTSLPEHLIIPSDTALITANINNKKLPFLNLDQAGRLWLRSIDMTKQKIEDRLDLRVFRLVDDLIPLKMTVRIEMDVAGNSRETMLGPVFDPGKFIPLTLESQIPARLLPDGRLRLQVRPGRWLVTVIARHLGGPASEIRLDDSADPWPDEEIWSFQAENQLRIVQPGGLASIDPQQTTMPPEWRHFPAFRARPNEALTLVQSRRGNPEPAPDQLSLNRTLWLCFDGAGFTMQDIISGTKNNDWRLEMPDPIILGRVAINGVDQFITRLPEKGAGVEVRQGILQLVADSVQSGDIKKIPITGWLQDFKSGAHAPLGPVDRVYGPKTPQMGLGFFHPPWSLAKNRGLSPVDLQKKGKDHAADRVGCCRC